MKHFKLDNEAKITSGFKTPDGYFDTFSEKFLADLPKEEPKVISLFSSRKNWYYAAAAIVILILSFPLYTKYTTNPEVIDSIALDNYLAYHPISEDVIVDLLDQEDIDKISLELKLDDAAIEEALQSNSNLENYILD